MKYRVIGKNEVAVPTHFFKVITIGEGNCKQQNAYILPNEPIDPSISLDSFRETIEKVEQVSGIIFH